MIPQFATVFVIDDEPEVREGLSRLLRSAGWDVDCCADAMEFLERGPPAGPACILLDVNMPGLSGPQLHVRLLAAGASTPVIFLTGNGCVAEGVRAIKNGAMDFLEKPVDADVLLPLVAAAVERHRRADRQAHHEADFAQRLAQLSAREREVMEHVMRGRLNKQIASDLGIAEKTVKVHRGRAMAKMRVRSVAELVHQYDEFGPAERESTPG